MKNFTPYGDEWKAEMMKFKKAEIIKILGDGLMKLEASRDEWRRIAMEAKARVEDLLQDMREIGVAE